MKLTLPLLVCLLLHLAAGDADSWYPASRSASWLDNRTTPVVGTLRDYIVAPGETLMEIAVRAHVGYENLRRANPGIDPWHPGTGRSVILPLAFLPPDGLTDGITVNLAELRLYLVWEQNGRRQVRAYALGIGREGWETPTGVYQVTRVVDHPTWTPPASLRAEKPDLPATVPPGPANPLGTIWIGTTAPGIGIHGTNQPFGVGRRVSHGCLRLYPRDIRDLARRVVPGMPLRIIDQPLKTVVQDNRFFFESHLNPGQPLPPGLPADAEIDRGARAGLGLPTTVPLPD